MKKVNSRGLSKGFVYFLIHLLICIVFLSYPNVSIVNANTENAFDQKRVLFISSYSSAFSTFYQQIDGINDTFEGYPVTVDMEFMDSKRFFTEENLLNFHDLIEYKINETNYDLVMVSDDNGLNFVMEYQTELFDNLPIVFFGINNDVNATQYSLDPLVTGVLEFISIRETIDLALSLNPNANEVIAISDNTPSGKADLIRFNSHESEYENLEFSALDMSVLTFDEFLDNLNQVDNEQVLILLSALRDVNNVNYDFEESVKLMVENSPQPIYHLFEHGIGEGLIGGRVVSHYNQGKTAAEIVLRIFEGEDIADIPLVQESPNQYLIDYEVFILNGFDEDKLPEDTILLNRNYSIFEIYREYIVLAVVFLLLQSSIIVLLIFSIIKRNIAKKEIIHVSHHDSLTGLHNRTYYEQQLPKLNKNELLPINIILTDLNGLKLINDAFGHKSGDEALIKTATVLLETFDDSDMISRIGGDEFAIVNNGKSKEYMFNKMDLLRENMKKQKVNGITLSLAIGMAIKVESSTKISDVFTEAEDRMYREKLNTVPSNRSDTINTIIATINQKDRYSELHSIRVSEIAEKIAQILDLDYSRVSDIKTAALLHDIGKIIVPTGILSKEGKLTDEEYNEIKKHSEIGFRILNSVSSMRNISEFVFCHHERIDGMGYPRGLQDKQIPLESKIISIADAIDAMLNSRTYRLKLSKEECYQELVNNKGTQFCEHIVSKVLDNYDEVYEVAITEAY